MKLFKAAITGLLSCLLVLNSFSSVLATTDGSAKRLPLGFKPYDALLDPEKPVVYLTDRANHLLYAVNYETEQVSKLQLRQAPEKMAYANHELYITETTGNHTFYPQGSQTGVIGIVNTEEFKLVDEFDIAVDPWDIAVDRSGFLYVSPGSGQWTEINSFNRETGNFVAKSNYPSIRVQSFLSMHPTQDKLVSVSTDTSPRSMTVWTIKDGTFGPMYSQKSTQGNFSLKTNFRISPDGQYVFNGSGDVFNTDMNHLTKLNTTFSDIAFDLSQNKFFVAQDYRVTAYNYMKDAMNYDFSAIEGYNAQGKVNELFYQDNQLIALTTNGSQDAIEIIPQVAASLVTPPTNNTPTPVTPPTDTDPAPSSNPTEPARGTLQVVNSFPEFDSEDVLVGFPLMIRFDRTLYPVTNHSSLSIVGPSGRQLPYHTEIGQDTLIIFPDEDLEFNTQYHVTIANGIVSDSTKSFDSEYIEFDLKTAEEYTRLAGTNRYNTSIKISQEGWSESDVAVLATGKDFPDALGATPLAKMYGAPLLLTDSQNLLPETEAELKRLGVSKVFIIGGIGAVSQEIESKLVSLNMETKRLAGNDRYETALAIANHIGQSEEIFVVTGSNFPDALSIASYAASKQIPIILTGQATLPKGVDEYISNNGVSKAYIIGGEGIISSQIEAQLPNPQRIAGKDRYETNFEILLNFNLYGTITFVATAENFPDALAGSALAGAGPFAVVLVSPSMPPDRLERLQSLNGAFKHKYVLGGDAIVRQSLLNEIFHQA